jgi:NAD(P)-dependent dehydrogenase (short-subunit alcohol dehydrogenase family)
VIAEPRPGAIVVSGASRGIGAAIALELARRGFTVGCLSRTGVAPAAAEGDAVLSSRLLPMVCDVTSESNVAKALAAVAEMAGGLCGLVNNAGIHLMKESASLATAEFEKVFATDVSAVFAACREAYPYLVRQGGGMIVNIGSFFDRMGVARNVAYCAAKAAVGAITRCLAVEWADKGIAVINIAPGYISTDLNREFLSNEKIRTALLRRIPVGRVGTPGDVASLVALLFDAATPFLTGETIYLDGGQGIAH